LVAEAFNTLVTRRLDKNKSGRWRYKLLMPLTWRTYRVPSGYITDLASIPKAFFLLDPADKAWAAPAVMHDWLCDEARAGRITMKEADALFFEALRDNGVSYVTAMAFWVFVRSMHKVKGDG
jgi:hypothetical protein